MGPVWADYLRQFQMVSAWNRRNLQEKAVQLAINLTGIARRTWVDNCSDVFTSVSYESLVATLTKQLKAEGQEEVYKTVLRHRLWKREESFMEYGMHWNDSQSGHFFKLSMMLIRT